MTPEQVTAYWPIVVAFLLAYGFIIGLYWSNKARIRDIAALQKELDAHKTDYADQQRVFWNKFDTFQVTLGNVQQSVAEIKGMLGAKNP